MGSGVSTSPNSKPITNPNGKNVTLIEAKEESKADDIGLLAHSHNTGEIQHVNQNPIQGMFDGHDEEESEEQYDQEDEAMREHFAMSAMALGMDNEDLLFNMLYFGNNTSNFQSMFNTAIEETVAAHSAENTPYKLRPATEEALSSLEVRVVTSHEIASKKEMSQDYDCSICQEAFMGEDEVVDLPQCQHTFHRECLLRWFRLQSWCPVCRTSISIGPDVANSTKTEAKAKKDGQAHETDSPKVNRNLFLVANAEDEYEDSSECKEG